MFEVTIRELMVGVRLDVGLGTGDRRLEGVSVVHL